MGTTAATSLISRREGDLLNWEGITEFLGFPSLLFRGGLFKFDAYDIFFHFPRAQDDCHSSTPLSLCWGGWVLVS